MIWLLLAVEEKILFKGLLFFGRVTAKLIENATCPVIMIPGGIVFNGLKHIVYVSNLFEEDVITIRSLFAMVEAFKSKITILHISATINDASFKIFEQGVRKQVDCSDINFANIQGSDPNQEIESYTKTTKTDLIVMLTRKKPLFENLYDATIARKFSYHSEIPLLVFH